MSEINNLMLVQLAIDARENSYAPYSNFRVGAALVTNDGKMFVGCNVENASYGLAICAERNAIASAIAAGHREFTSIAIAAEPIASPCGACRQFLAEFNLDMTVMAVDPSEPEKLRTWLVRELLPDSFRLKN